MKHCDIHMIDGCVNDTRLCAALNTQCFVACILWLNFTYRWLKDC